MLAPYWKPPFVHPQRIHTKSAEPTLELYTAHVRSEPFSDMRKTLSKDWNSPQSQFAMHLMQLKSGRGIKL